MLRSIKHTHLRLFSSTRFARGVSDNSAMRLLGLIALCAATASGLVFDSPTRQPPGSNVCSVNDQAELKRIGAHHPKHHDRRTVTIRSSHNDTDDVSADFLWGIRRANHGGRLLLEKGHKYVIGRKLDLTFLDNVEVQWDGELKVSYPQRFAFVCCRFCRVCC